ncbi:MAG: hypothetical protein ABIA12_01900 [Candidatus Aenigmatarchaeota archaeon]
MALADILELWKSYGVFEFYLPFVLMFAIFYGLLSKSKIFGDEDKERRVRNINVVISVVAALFVMVSPVGVSMTVFFGTFFTQTMVILTTMLCFVMIFYMIIPHDKIGEVMKEPAKYVKYLIPFALLATLAIFFGSGAPEIFGISFGRIALPWLDLSSQDIVTLALILIFLLIVFYMTRGEEKKKGKKVVGYTPTPIYEE